MKHKITIAQESIEEIVKEWQRDNPGRAAEEMTPTEFSDRLMRKALLYLGDDEQEQR